MDPLLLVARDDVFSASAAQDAGVTGAALARLVRAGRCVRLTRGWYAVRLPRDATDRHRLTAIALAREYAGRAVVSHHSALVLLGLPAHGVDLATVHLMLTGSERGPASGSAVRRRGLVLHRRLPDPVPPRTGDVPLPSTAAHVPPALAIVQAGLSGSAVSALVAADAALHRGVVGRADLDAAIRTLAGRTGIGPVRAALSQADGRVESVGESVTGHVVRALGFVIEPQHEVVVDGRRYRADFRIAGTRVLLEFDGKVKYSQGDATVLFDEKRREDALRRAGWVVVRLVWSDLKDPAMVRRRILAALAMAVA